MGSHPANFALRFGLELVALGAFGYWGFNREPALLRAALTVGLPLLAATLWAVFAVAGDPSRSGQTVIATPGALRLLLELAFFGLAAAALWHVGLARAGLTLAVVVAIHYAASFDRVAWLLRH